MLTFYTTLHTFKAHKCAEIPQILYDPVINLVQNRSIIRHRSRPPAISVSIISIAISPSIPHTVAVAIMPIPHSMVPVARSLCQWLIIQVVLRRWPIPSGSDSSEFCHRIVDRDRSRQLIRWFHRSSLRQILLRWPPLLVGD